MHIKLTNGAPENYSVAQLRADNPQTSFPAQIPDSLLAEWDVYPLTPTVPPAHDHTKTMTEGTPVQVDGVWTQVWVMTDATQEEIDQRTQDQASNARAERNAKLASSDWTQVADAPVDKAAWAAYRQNLRDVTAQAGFPWSIQWPVEPV